MILPSLRSLPAGNLGRRLYEWDHKPPFTKNLLVGGAIMAIIIGAIYWFVYSEDRFDFLRQYSGLLVYIAVPLLSYFLGKVISATRLRRFALHERGFFVYYGKMENKKVATSWAPWADFDRAELLDNGVKLFPKNPLQQSVMLYCETNRMNVYGLVSSQIAQHRYTEFTSP